MAYIHVKITLEPGDNLPTVLRMAGLLPPEADALIARPQFTQPAPSPAVDTAPLAEAPKRARGKAKETQATNLAEQLADVGAEPGGAPLAETEAGGAVVEQPLPDEPATEVVPTIDELKAAARELAQKKDIAAVQAAFSAFSATKVDQVPEERRAELLAALIAAAA